MLSNYVKVALRNLVKSKVYSLITLSSLAVGMASVILIAAYVGDELGYDRFHVNVDRIYRVTLSDASKGIPDWAGTPALLGPALQQRLPEIEEFVRVDPFTLREQQLFSYGDKSFYERGFILADPALFKMFDFRLIEGDPETALAQRRSLVVSKSAAKKYFRDDNPIGKTLTLERNMDFIVTGIMEDIPPNSSLKFDLVAPFKYLDEIYQQDIMSQWGRHNYYTYVLVKENANVRQLESKTVSCFNELSTRSFTSAYFQPISEIHLRSNFARDPYRTASMADIYFYVSIACVIVLIASINFMSLYAAHSEIRAKEIGVRKVLGAQRRQLVLQFLTESVAMSFLALPIALILVESALPAFNRMIERTMTIDYTNNLVVVSGLLVLSFVIGVLSGSYPALVLSTFPPVTILRGTFRAGVRKIQFRNVLVVFQFVVTIVIIASSLVIRDQMQYTRTMNLGYDRDNIVNVSMPDRSSPGSTERYRLFRTEILRNPKIVDATATSFSPSLERWREGNYFEGRKETDTHMFFRIFGDHNVIDFFHIELLAGRAFDAGISSDSANAFVLNESAAKSIGWTPQEAVGKVFGGQQGKVVGVVKDFHFRSLRREMQPLAINVLPRMFQFISIRMSPGDVQTTMAFLKDAWKQVNPGVPFEFAFYDEEFDRLYKADLKLQMILEYSAFLAILIAAIGVLGLSLFTVRRRTKEIGIRKVLGSGVPGILRLLLTGVLRLIFIASVFALPIAYLLMHSWLHGFAYPISLSWMTFVAAGLILLFVSVATIMAQVIKAALGNPVEALRNE